jgi:hypothetical protein
VPRHGAIVDARQPGDWVELLVAVVHVFPGRVADLPQQHIANVVVHGAHAEHTLHGGG